MKKHEQVFVKVNVPIDKGVKGIVSTLSQFQNLETVESCEGNTKRGPWICFRYGAYWKHPYCELTDFVLGYLAPHLNKIVGDDAIVRIQTTPSGQIFGELSIRPGAASRVETALRKLVRDFSVFQCHNSECCDDKTDTVQQHY